MLTPDFHEFIEASGTGHGPSPIGPDIDLLLAEYRREMPRTLADNAGAEPNGLAPATRETQAFDDEDSHEPTEEELHAAMLAGDTLAAAMHDPEECYACLMAQPPTISDCRCGKCCESLILEADLQDAEREPRIRELGSPIYTPGCLTRSGQNELSGFMLNSRATGACVFLCRDEHGIGNCGIYATRPLMCRLFDCDHSPQAEHLREEREPSGPGIAAKITLPIAEPPTQ